MVYDKHRIEFRVLLRRFLIVVGVLGLPGWVLAGVGNLVVNGGFEEGQAPWKWEISEEAKAGGRVDTAVRHTGRASYRVTNQSKLAPNVYGQATQIVGGLKPETGYVIGAWCRGRAARRVRLQAGPKWTLTRALPDGDSDWTWRSGVYTTAKGQTSLPVMFLVEEVTDAAWFDDVEVVELADWKKTMRLYPRTEITPLRAADRLYPAPHTDRAESSPVLAIRHADDDSLGCDVRLAWNEQAIVFDIDVLDPTPGAAKDGGELWMADSVQIGIDTAPDTPGTETGYTKTSYELGFSTVTDDGNVNTFDWQPGNMNWAGVKASGKRTQTGYRLYISIPWENLGLDSAKLPRQLGVNVLVNDWSPLRRYVEWTPGIGSEKNPNLFARVFLISGDQVSGSVGRFRFVRDIGTLYDGQDDIVGRYVEYTPADAPAEKVGLVSVDEKGRRRTLGYAKVPAGSRERVRRMDFIVPSAILATEGRYRFEIEPDGDARRVARMKPLRRLNVTTRVKKKLAGAIRRTDALSETLANEPKLATDAYVRMGLPVARFYIQHIQDGGWPGEQTPAWDLMQLEEIESILDLTDRRIARLRKGEVQPYRLREIQPGSVRIRGGKFHAKPVGKDSEEVFYLGGYGMWDKTMTDIDMLHATGMNLTQQSVWPRLMNEDGTAKYVGIPSAIGDRPVVNTLEQARAKNVLVDILPVFHYLPDWTHNISGLYDPRPLGFIKFYVDHPSLKKIVRQYFDLLMPIVRDHPALLSICLTNEPIYNRSGRDEYSRPAWTAYLKNRHKSINALNALYGTKYRNFEGVPVPKIVDTYADWDKLALGQKRAHYDWAIFNQKHFADWHAWLRDEVHKRAPNVPTHAKIMPHIFDPHPHHIGVDPERFCRQTEIAGNDSFGKWSWTPGGQYAYDWAPEEAWYELLYSLSGKPVYNSENHLVNTDLSAIHIPAGHTHTGIWQSVLHHCWGSVLWTWEVFPPHESAPIYRRPANTHAAGKAMIDLDRLVDEVAAITDAPDEIAILYSMPSILWQKDSAPLLPRLFTAVSFLGKPVRFISERQLAEGGAPKELKWVLLPHTTHVKDATVKALAKFAQAGGHVVPIGKNGLLWNEYHQTRTLPAELAVSMIPRTKETQRLAEELRNVMTKGGMKFISLMDVDKAKPVWGVEYQAVDYNGATLVPMVNFLNQPLTVRLEMTGKAYDLIAEENVNLGSIVLEPMAAKLLRIPRNQE